MTPFHVLLLTLAIGHGADAASALHCPTGNCRELNPLVINPYTHSTLFVTQVAVTTAAEAYLLNRLRQNHPKWAWTLGVASLSVTTWAIQHNVRLDLTRRTAPPLP